MHGPFCTPEMLQRRRFRKGRLVSLRVLGMAVAAVGLVSCTSTSQATPAAHSPLPTFPPLPSFGIAPQPSLSPTPVGTLPVGPVPKGFVPSSVTFVSLDEGWVVGSAPCQNATCLVLLKTLNAGRTWVSVQAPPTAFSDGDSQDLASVDQIRFADPNDGWAYGPALWSTHDGGAHWRRDYLPSQASPGIINDIEAARGIVDVGLLDNDFDARIETSPVGTDAWHETPISVPGGAGPVPATTITLSGSEGWMVQVDRTVLGGARFGRTGWSAWQPPCMTGSGGLILAASTASNVAAVCSDGQWTNFPARVEVAFSDNSGTTFTRAALQPGLVMAENAASPAPGAVVVATLGAGGNVVFDATYNGGATWEKVFGTITDDYTGFIGFTSPSQGVAILDDDGGTAATLLMTFNGGRSWAPVPFRQAS